MAAFFTSLLPQFVAGGAPFGALLLLGLCLSVMTLAWLAAYGVAVARVGEVLRRPLVRRVTQALTGDVAVALGLRLATERRSPARLGPPNARAGDPPRRVVYETLEIRLHRPQAPRARVGTDLATIRWRSQRRDERASTSSTAGVQDGGGASRP
jgi:hypothetical protein